MSVREDQEHLSVCPGYDDLRIKKDLEVEEELVEFFAAVMDRRAENGWN